MAKVTKLNRKVSHGEGLPPIRIQNYLNKWWWKVTLRVKYDKYQFAEKLRASNIEKRKMLIQSIEKSLKYRLNILRKAF